MVSRLGQGLSKYGGWTRIRYRKAVVPCILRLRCTAHHAHGRRTSIQTDAATHVKERLSKGKCEPCQPTAGAHCCDINVLMLPDDRRPLESGHATDRETTLLGKNSSVTQRQTKWKMTTRKSMDLDGSWGEERLGIRRTPHQGLVISFGIQVDSPPRAQC